MNRYKRFKEMRREPRPPPLSPVSPPQMPSPGVPPLNGDQVLLLQQVQVHQQQVDQLLHQYKVQRIYDFLNEYTYHIFKH